MTPDVARKHDKRGQLDRSICGACRDAFWECSGCGVYFCDCSRSIEACAPEPRSRPIPEREVRDALTRLDGSDEAAVSLLTGFSAEEIEDLGGLRTRPVPTADTETSS